jgi:hypothetical protein
MLQIRDKSVFVSCPKFSEERTQDGSRTCAGYLRHPFKKREQANLRSINSREDPHTTKEKDDILSLYERRKTEEKDKKTPVS